MLTFLDVSRMAHFNNSQKPLKEEEESEGWSSGPGPSSEGSMELADSEFEKESGDAEGVWSPDIEQAFQEALTIYPPCGRRKIILSEEGKMYGRNELIAHYIKMRTGKVRTRKQVSSHIQVLARRKLREVQASLKVALPKDQLEKEKVLQSIATMSSPQIVSAAANLKKPPVKQVYAVNSPPDIKPITPPLVHVAPIEKPVVVVPHHKPEYHSLAPPWEGRSISARKLRLIEFSAFMEDQTGRESQQKVHLFVHIGGDITYADPPLEAVDVRQIYDKFPQDKGGLKELYDRGPQDAFFLVKFWADLNTDIDEATAFYGVSSWYESTEQMSISCSTKVCSFGKQVVEKIETGYTRFEGDRFVFRIHHSPMCDYMINFIRKLKNLPKEYSKNSVLENFTILQVLTNRDTLETLLCKAYIFEVSTSVHGAQHHIYKLVKD